MPPQQQQQGGQQGGSSQNSSDFFWMVAIAITGIVILWHFKREPITKAIFWVRLKEISLIKAVLGTWSQILYSLHIESWLPLKWVNWLQQADGSNLDDWVRYVNSVDPAHVAFSVVEDLSLVVGYYLRYPVAFLCVLSSAFMFFKHSKLKYNNRMTMKKLRSLEKVNWPYIAPVVYARKDLIKTPLEEKPWSMADNPMQFSRRHKLLEEYTKNYKPAVRLLEDKAARILSLQMGALWEGPAKLPIHIQALFAIFAAKGNRDGASANRLLAKISKSSSSIGKLNFSGTRLLLIKHVRTRVVGYAVCRHAYVLTAMASMLELARTDGVLAVAEFLWLKKIDRTLWYMLSTVGRQTAFSEVGGPYAHWLMEKKLGRPMKIPMVKEAVVALKAAIEAILYDPEDKLND